METYIIKIYPHKYMDRAEQDHFRAINIAHETSMVIAQLLKADPSIRYINKSTNDTNEYLILNPHAYNTTVLKRRIEDVLPEVHFVRVYTTLNPLDSTETVVHNEIHNSNIGIRFQEDAINQMYEEEDDYHTGF